MPSSKTSVDKRDVYYRKGKSEGYRARSAYKLLHLDEEFDLFTGVRTAVDLCAAPGSWSQVLAQKLRPGKGEDDAKVVSLDLQAMTPLKDITILQTDITLPSTIPLVLKALGGRKADLVVCDGAPDVTGVHDLDAYLHSQLLLAALTLSLTLLAPQSTLIFKIFLSPLDPKADLLRSQLRIFFPSPPQRRTSCDGYEEREMDVEPDVESEDGREPDERKIGEEGYDLLGRRGGVWVRKPRSSRAGSGEAFIVCRNFDPSKVPLPPTFSSAALRELASQKNGTLTLESLAYLGDDGFKIEEEKMREWGRIKAFVGSGSLDGPIPAAKMTSLRIQVDETTPTLDQTDVQTSPMEIDPPIINTIPETPSEIPSTVSSIPTISSPPPSTSHLHLSPNHRYANSATRRAAAWALSNGNPPSARQQSTDSLSPPSSASPTSTFFSAAEHRPWDKSAGPPSPLPSPLYMQNEAEQTGFPDLGIAIDSGAISPALSSGSKTDLFFASSQKNAMPVPPKPLPNSLGLGRGLPPGVRGSDRSASTPTPSSPVVQTASKSNSLFAIPSISVPSGPYVDSIALPSNRSVSNPAEMTLTLEKNGKSIFSIPAIPSGGLSTLPTQPSFPSANVDSSPRPPTVMHERRESKSITREQKESYNTSLNSGDILSAAAEGLDEFDVKSSDKTCWKLEKVLGEGAFSAVWSAVEVPSSESPVGNTQTRVAAIKTMDKRLCAKNSRTRISFVREVEVLKHISHPSIVGYLSSFSTGTHHCLVLEQLGGGELFELISVEENRKRMLLPSPGSREGLKGEVVDLEGFGFVRRIFGELCRAVGWLHEVGVVHRDIKLENLLLTVNPFTLPPTSTDSIPLHLLPRPPQPLLKLTDFGLSRFINPEEPLLQTRCGSESFAAPEIIMGRPYDGRRTDSWAVGVVLYALVAGELPFDEGSPIAEKEDSRSRSGSVGSRGYGERDERRRTMMRIAKGEYMWREGMGNEGVKKVVGRLLVRDPKKRASVKDIWDEEWMVGPGAADRPRDVSPGVSPKMDGGDGVTSATVAGTGARTGRKRRILDGFLVDGEMISEVAMAES